LCCLLLQNEDLQLKQTHINQEHTWVSLPPQQSSTLDNKAVFTKKQLTENQKSWLLLHDESNWKDVVLSQDYQTKKNRETITKKIIWKLPGTTEKREDCGTWLSKGCFNISAHPEYKAHVIHTKRSCFRSSCEYCWLEKWLSRESSRATRRIEKYTETWKRINQQYEKCHIFEPRKYLKPIHVIVSPSWKDKFMRYDLLKKKCRKMLDRAGVQGGLMIYHPFGLNRDTGEWVTRPHFHVVGFGWVVNTKKISDEDGWVIKNKGVRDSLHSTVYYQLSHAGVSNDIHSITWFGVLGYRAKYSINYKIEDDESFDFCDFCGCMFVQCEYVGLDRPPDYEFAGLVSAKDWKPLETLAEAVDRKNRFKKEEVNSNPYWNKKCRKSW